MRFGARKSNHAMNVASLKKGEERYMLFYGDTGDDIAKALRALGVWASNKEISFTWYDAAVLSMKVRKSAPPNETRRDKEDQ